MRITTLACCLLLLAVPASTQSFRIADGNVELVRHVRIVPGLFSSVFSATPCAESHMHGNDWCYKVANGPGRSIDGLGNGDYALLPHEDSFVEQRITDVDSIGGIDAILIDSVVSTGAESGELTSMACVTNVASTPLTVRLYNFSNPDLNDVGDGEYGDYTLPCSTAERILIGDGEDCGGFLALGAVGATGFQVGSPADVVGVVNAGGALPGGVLPFGSVDAPRDVAVAFSWEATLAPGESLAGVVIVESVRRGVVGDIAHVGVAGGGVAAPTLHCDAVPRFGRPIPFRVETVGDRSGVLLFALTPSPTQVVALGLAIIAQPVVAAAPFVTAAGRACHVVALGCDGSVVGVAIAVQAFVDDPNSTAALPLSHSDVLVATIGD